MRGAWMWPSFIALTLLDGLLLHELPPVRTGVDLIPGILLATFANLILIGAVAPWLARRIWKRRREATPGAPPRAQLEVLADRMGTGLLVASVFGVLAAGLAARPNVVSETAATEENARAVRDYVLHSGNAELTRNLETANTVRLADGYFRTCVARDDRRRHFCLFVNTDRTPTEVVKDRSEEPNSAYKMR
ncbi:MAG TPA: hypothetical protein VEQ61_06050 [Thermoleophilaceae bacterium]|nr:hypothetical protein [Thermoleophilaceae bacterium]